MGSKRSKASAAPSRADAVKRHVTTTLKAARDEYIAAAAAGRAGRDVQARYTAQIDAIVTQLAEAGRDHTGAALVVFERRDAI